MRRTKAAVLAYAQRTATLALAATALLAGSCSSDSAPSGANNAIADAGSPDVALAAPDGAQVDAGVATLFSAVASRFPAADAAATCADAPLHLKFSSAVTLGSAGKIQLWRAGDSDAGGPVDTIDMAAPMFTATIGGRLFNRNRPVVLDGTEAIVAFAPQAMTAGASYYVTIDEGVFVDATQKSLGSVQGSSAWRFTTSGRAPASPAALTVAADGTGDFCTVQGAIDYVPASNTSPVTVTVKKGTYREIVFIGQKSNITLHGEDRKATIIAYANNNTLNPHTGTRAMVEVEGSNGLIIENMTLHNVTPQGGSQAEALRVEPSDQVILRNADFISTQDTLLLTGRVYVSNSYVEGNVDFIWGKGTAYFDHCELKTVGRAGYEVQARNAAGVYGYVFVDSTLTSTAGITGNFLGRIDVSAYPASQVAYINCKMDKHIDPKGWLITGAGTAVITDGGSASDSAVDAAAATEGGRDASVAEAAVGDSSSAAVTDAQVADGGVTDAALRGEAGSSGTSLLQFAEFQSTDLAGQLLDVSQRVAASKQLSAAEAAMLRDKTVVLAGWNPPAAP